MVTGSKHKRKDATLSRLLCTFYFTHCTLSVHRLLLHLLRLIVSRKRLDDRLQLPVHHLLQLVHGQANTMVGHAVLGEIVGADLLAAVAAAHLLLALLGQGLLLPLHLYFIKTGAQYAHSLLTVLDLRFLVLATHHRIGWDVRDADSRVRRIHRLSAGSR